MKKTLLALSILAIGSINAIADVHIDLQAGNLQDSTGAGVPVASLLLVIASGADLQFQNQTQPTSLSIGQYVSGDDTIVAAYAINNNLGGSVGTVNFSNIAATQGQYLALRWFPAITYASYTSGTTPALDNYYGTFAGATTGASGSVNGGDPWVVPASGGSLMLNMLTVDLNYSSGAGLPDPVANSAGKATVKVGSVPEPSTVLLMGMGLAGLLARRRRA